MAHSISIVGGKWLGESQTEEVLKNQAKAKHSPIRSASSPTRGLVLDYHTSWTVMEKEKAGIGIPFSLGISFIPKGVINTCYE